MTNENCIIYSGIFFQIEWYFDSRGYSQAFEYFQECNVSQKRKFLLLCQKLGDFGKIHDETKFRKDMYKSKRKELSEIWNGDYYLDIANIVRFTPSACNTQPWIVDSSENELKVHRYRKPGKRGIMPIDMVKHYNQIDIGIFLCFLELCLNKNNIKIIYIFA